MAKARQEFEASLVFPDGAILRMRVWEVPEPVPPSARRFKYSLYYGRPASGQFSMTTSVEKATIDTAASERKTIRSEASNR